MGAVGAGVRRKGSPKVSIASPGVIRYDILAAWFVSLLTKPGQKVHINGVFILPCMINRAFDLKDRSSN